MAELPETLSKLSDVRKQQTASLQTLERLTQQQLSEFIRKKSFPEMKGPQKYPTNNAMSMRFSIINHPFVGYPHLWNPP
jgi:hypothetical protein